MVEPVLAAAATVLAAVFLVPQIVRLVVQRDAAGVSPTWAAFGVVTNAAWVAYLGANGLWAAAAAPALAGRDLRHYSRGARAARSPRRVGLELLSLRHGIGPRRRTCRLAPLGIVLVSTPVIQLLPQIAKVFRTVRPSGLSPVTWSLAILEAVLWGGDHPWPLDDHAGAPTAGSNRPAERLSEARGQGLGSSLRRITSRLAGP